PGLFTSRYCCSGEAAAHEAVVNYCEWAARKKKKGDSPLFYILIILALKKMKEGKKGTVPFFFARRGKNADRKKRN
ncbi:MAG: hypothetical protein KAU46_01980, partial [Candidatus Aminicenantes bacterium]|nr:hypothetical protein [Candidatus Aminicenantes bacterium]